MNKIVAFSLIAGVGSWLNSAALFASEVQFPTGPAAWTVVISPPKSISQDASSGSVATAGTPARIAKIEVTQDDRKRRCVITSTNGQVTERWTILKGNLLLVEEPNGNIIAVPAASDIGSMSNLPFMEPSFRWVKPENLQSQDPVNYQGKSCFHFQANIDYSHNFIGPLAISGKHEAWIDTQTMLPVALEDGSGLGIFTFQKEPPPPLNFPAKYKKILDRLYPPNQPDRPT